MTGNSAPSPAPPAAEVTLAGRLERLVNNEQFADVAFRVGEPGEVMFGHKAILTEACEVFRAQFSGMFRESRENVREHEIPVVDIEPGTFKELLRYMYSERVNVTADNVVDIFYGSKKYMLTNLSSICEKFIRKSVTEKNVLRVFDSNRRYELEEVNRICLDIICDNPIKAFEDEAFLTLSRKSVELIASCQLINCQTDQLLKAIEQWLHVNEDETEDGTKIVAKVREQTGRGLKCKKMHNFAAGHYVSSIGFQQPPPFTLPTQSQSFSFASYNPSGLFQASSISSPATPTSTSLSTTQMTYILKIDTDKPFSIYGVGIYIKSKQFQQTVTLEIFIDTTHKADNMGIFNASTTTKRTVTAKEDICVEEILFKKQPISSEVTCTIRIQMQHGITSLFCLKNFEPEQPEVGLRFTCSNSTVPLSTSNQSGTNSCVAYVLYNLGEQKKVAVKTKSKFKV